MRKVLWLASWYPNEADPFSGDFIKRQAEAVSVFQPLKIIFTGKYSPEAVHNKLLPGFFSENLQEYILYYPPYGTESSFLSRFFSLRDYFKKHLAAIKQLQLNHELPDIVHVQVAMKAGLIALYLKWKYKIPYVLTEHWSGYYSQSRDSLFKKSFLTRYFTRLIIKKADRFLPVSEALGNQIMHHWVKVPFQKIPNVVNTRFFFPSENPPEGIFRLIHISTLQYPKNPEGIIRSFSGLLKLGFQAELVMVGPLNTVLHDYASTVGVPPGKILFTGEIPYEQVGAELRKSFALVMFSEYENMPCVAIEALCTGIPVIATRVGGIPEIIQEENGILINPGNEKELLEAMIAMMRNHSFYDRVKISRQAAARFSYETIGKEIIQVYDSVLAKE
ncbi:MAG TPA: hypothetical protein DIC22_01385 [Chitinophagaceae bacterium]|nr:hypothetical protein [Chitinophagaceae bacterium]